jgi:hypothetical protein
MRTMHKYVCKQCGRHFEDRRSQNHTFVPKYCSRECFFVAHTGSANNLWKGGRSVPKTLGKYVMVRGIRKNGRRGAVKEHLLLAERALGHPLPSKAQVHHANGDSRDNSSGNLVICENAAYHRLLHARMKRLKDCGSLDKRRCLHCHLVKDKEAFTKSSLTWDGLDNYCRACKRIKKGRF